MIDEELIRIWQSSPNQERIKFEKSRLMIDAQSSIDRLHRNIRFRDLREQIAIAIVIPAFAYSAYALPYLLTRIASVLIILWAVYIAIKLRNAKKHKPGAFTETYLEYLYKTREYIQIQKQMMENVVYWYILPGMTFTFLFLLGLQGAPGKSNGIVKVSVLNVLLAIVSYFMNKATIKKQFIPRLVKIEELIKVMERGE